MNEVRKKFILSAMIALTVLLTVLLAIINGINFTMVARDADRVTERIASDRGDFSPPGEEGFFAGQMREMGRFDRMGPDSPETPYSARYFTYRILKDGTAEEVAFRISAFSREEAEKIALSLKNESTGWTHQSYRYRVYRDGKDVFVTVVDQSRELLPSFRILIISVLGEIVGLGVCFVFLTLVSKKLFSPLEEADRKQKEFLAEAENELKIPMTVIYANTEILEKTSGPNEYTRSIRRQAKKITDLTRRLGQFALWKEKKEPTLCDLSQILRSSLDAARERFREAGIEVREEIWDGVTLPGDEEALCRTAEELVENALKFARRYALFTLEMKDGSVVLSVRNDTDLPEGSAEQVFDRFTRLENARDLPGSGLGLSYVKEAVLGQNGRASAKVEKGEFILRITF